MDRTKREVPEGIRSVKAAISLYGGRVPGRKPEVGANYRSHTEEVRAAKEEVRRVKNDMIAASKAKKKAEKEIEASAARVNLYEKFAEEMREDIERADEENVIVELARIEAERERKEIEARRGEELTQFSSYMETAKKNIDGLRSEIDRAKELEAKLAATNLDVIAIQKEMEQLRLMDRDSEKNSLVVINSAETKLTAAKNELKSIEEVGFQFMFSMDLVTQELMQIAQETSRLNKLEKKVDSKVQNLKSKLLEAKSKLKHALVADERAKQIISNLSSALQKAEAETDAAVEEKEVIFEETEAIKTEIYKVDLDIKTAEEGIQAAMKDLETVKASEALAIKKLRHVRERMMRSRASPSLQGSTITISRTEYNYLKKRAEGTKAVAEKKVAAAQAWIEALKAGEMEILMQCEIVEREIREIEAAKEQVGKKQGPDKEEVANLELAVATPRKSMRENKIPATVRRAKVRRLSSSAGIMYDPRSPSFAIKKRTKVIPNLPKFVNPRGN